jgi:hypothetical protein
VTDELARGLAEAKRLEEETGWSDLHAARTVAREVLAAGTSVRIVSPNAEESDLLGVIEFWRCASVRLGAPNDEALHGHPLNDKGLELTPLLNELTQELIDRPRRRARCEGAVVRKLLTA